MATILFVLVSLMWSMPGREETTPENKAIEDMIAPAIDQSHIIHHEFYGPSV